MFVKVTVAPDNWYPLEMALVMNPLPGQPESYAIHCRRSPDSPIPDTSNAPYNAPMQYGDWSQPVSREFFLKIMKNLESARVPPMTRHDWGPILDGPEKTTFVLEVSGARFQWTDHDSVPGWEPLKEVAHLMLVAVMAARPVEVDPPYFQREDH